MEKIKEIINSRKGKWLLAFGLTFLCYAIVLLTADVSYATNDDSRIMYALAGYASGEAYPQQAFINYFLGVPIGVLYKLLPSLPWYTIYHIFAMYLSESVMFLCFYKLAKDKKVSIAFPICAQIISLLFIFMVPLVSIQFTVTSTILGTSAVVVMASMKHSDKRSTKICIYAYCFIALLLSFMTRTLSWYSIMCFFALSCVYQIATCYLYCPDLTKKKKHLHTLKICTFVIALVISCFGVRFVSLYVKNKSEITQAYNTYNDYRVKYMDYGQHPPYKGHEKLYNAVQWDNSTYRATLCLLYMDENINASSLKTITEAYQANKHSALSKTVTNIRELLYDYSFVQYSLLSIFLIFVILNLMVAKKEKQWFHILVSICCCGGFAVLLLYLGFKGRLPLRSYQSLLIPCFMFMMTMFLRWLDVSYKKVFKPMLAITLVVSVGGIYMVYIDKDYAATQTNTEATSEQFQNFEKYAIQNPEHFYVYDFSAGTVNRNPFVVYPNEKPINTMVAGGSYTFSELYYQQLEKNGLTSLYWEDLLKKNIYFTSANPTYVEVAQMNIERVTKHKVKVKEIKRFGENTKGITVYKFSAAETSKKKDSHK